MSCEHCKGDLCVSRVPIFNHLDLEQQMQIMQLSITKHYKRNEVVFNADDVSDSLFIVNKGRVKVFSLDENGKEHLINVLNAGDYIGENSLFMNEVQQNYATATEETSICLIRKQDVMGLLSEYPTIAIKILEEFARRLDSSQTQAKWLGTTNAKERLNKYLVGSAVQGNKRLMTTLSMPRKDLANYLGMSAETLSRGFSALEDEGIIRQLNNREIEILEVQ